MSVLRPTRRWLRFSLRTFLIVVTLICIWSAWHVNRARRQKEAVEALQVNGGRVYYDYQFDDNDDDAQRPNPTAGSPWSPGLIETFGIDMFHNVVAVTLLKGSDDVMPQLASLPSLRQLSLLQATDDTILQIDPLSNLEYLSVEDFDRVSNNGLKHLCGLRQLKSLLIMRGQFTDESLALISRLPRIEALHLYGKRSRLSDAGLEHMANKKRLRHLVICFDEGEITDQSAKRLLNLQRLEVLSLMPATLSTQMQDRLKKLPNLKRHFFRSATGD